MRSQFARSSFLLTMSVIAVLLSWSARVRSDTPEPVVLARVELAGAVSAFPLPAYALLPDSSGHEYLLVVGTEAQLRETGWPWRALDQPAVPEQYVIATELRPGARSAAAGRFAILHDDGVRWVMRATPAEAEALAELGFGLHRLMSPIVWSTPPRHAPKDGESGPMPDPLVSGMIRSVESTNLHWLVRRLSGEETTVSGGEPFVFNTRHTASGVPVRKAVGLAFERLQSLGLSPQYHAWTSSGYSGSNVVATLPGGTRSNELVLITAHLDSTSSGAKAPGADDNASGSAAVLTAAGIFSQYRFERSLRFVLFTGEEQGLLGSGQYAAAALSAGDKIVAVLNLDMIAWDSSGPATLQLHTRSSSDPGSTNDLAIASVFTNVVAAYGLSTNVVPVIKRDGLNASDHASFWNRSYAAILAIEDYGVDFNPYLHTVNDTLSRLNLRYFTASAQAALGTAAHLAAPVSRVPCAVVEVANSDWSPGSGFGAGVFLAEHRTGASESGLEPWDVTLSNAPPNPDPKWFKLSTQPYGIELAADARPDGSESIFRVNLTAVAPAGAVVSSSNRLRLDFLAPPAADRIFTARIRVDHQFTQQLTDFLCVTNLRDLVQRGGHVELPALRVVPAGTAYGTCEIAPRLLDTNRVNCRLRWIPATGPTLVLATDAQIGVRIVDDLEVNTALRTNGWQPVTTFTNDVAPDAGSFDTGWKELLRPVDAALLPVAPERFFRLRRTWIIP